MDNLSEDVQNLIQMALETAQQALKQSNNISTICDEMHEEI